MTEGEALAESIFEYDAPGERTPGTFTATTIYGEEITIVRKYGTGNGVTVLVADNGAEYIANPEGGDRCIRFDEELHAGGASATGEAGALTPPSEDATVAADVRAELDQAHMADGVDATDAADASAELEARLNPSPGDGFSDGGDGPSNPDKGRGIVPDAIEDKAKRKR